MDKGFGSIQAQRAGLWMPLNILAGGFFGAMVMNLGECGHGLREYMWI